MDKFIIVFSAEDKEKLIRLGFHFMYEDTTSHMFVFLSNPTLCFALNGVKMITSNTLTL